jgi:formylglycine-generating enzyme required for sulfatase activity
MNHAIFPLLLRGHRFPLLINVQYANVTDGQMPPEDFYRRLGRVVPSKSKVEKRPAERPPQPAPAPEVVSQPPVVERRHPFEPELIHIPAGEFLMGSDPDKYKRGYSDEKPQHTRHLPDYYIAKTPATNTQYAAFVEATDRKTPEHWNGGKPPGGKEDHPVVNVSWHDAMAYCQWLAQETAKAYRLPSEAEWEKAARGPDGRIWPWGNEWGEKLCNSLEDGRGDTTLVGQYSPGGDSPYGCVDMAGNVWEWTLSLWGTKRDEPDFKYPYDPGDGRENLGAGPNTSRVLRGGTFLDDRGLMRCAYRRRYPPDYRYYRIGFRLAVAPGYASDP